MEDLAAVCGARPLGPPTRESGRWCRLPRRADGATATQRGRRPSPRTRGSRTVPAPIRGERVRAVGRARADDSGGRPRLGWAEGERGVRRRHPRQALGPLATREPSPSRRPPSPSGFAGRYAVEGQGRTPRRSAKRRSAGRQPCSSRSRGSRSAPPRSSYPAREARVDEHTVDARCSARSGRSLGEANGLRAPSGLRSFRMRKSHRVGRGIELRTVRERLWLRAGNPRWI